MLDKQFQALQEAQLPLRNRASAMHFFAAKLLSIAVMTYTYVYPQRNLRPANVLRTQRINFSMRPQHVRITRDITVVWCLLSRQPLRIQAWTLYCQKLESLSYTIAADDTTENCRFRQPICRLMSRKRQALRTVRNPESEKEEGGRHKTVRLKPTRYHMTKLIVTVAVLGKNIWGPGPSSFGKQQRLSEIYYRTN